jgi:excisionase family DNA binding protein
VRCSREGIPVSLDAAVEQAVAAALEKALGRYLRRLSDPEPLVYSVREAAHVLATSTTTVRRLVDDGVLPTVPHMGQRIVIPRIAVVDLVASRGAAAPRTRLRVADRG